MSVRTLTAATGSPFYTLGSKLGAVATTPVPDRAASVFDYVGSPFTLTANHYVMFTDVLAPAPGSAAWYLKATLQYRGAMRIRHASRRFANSGTLSPQDMNDLQQNVENSLSVWRTVSHVGCTEDLTCGR